ncbi:MAG: ABC transporter permease [Candidatus Aminicenantes bacterium]|nr:ABC transporter permease [Candidatus Aminicenantes bacterium]
MRKSKAFLKKEFLHLIRDPKSLFLISLLPVIMLLFYGYVVRMDVKNIKFGVVNYDHSQFFEGLVSDMEASSYFTREGEFPSLKDCEKWIVKGKVDACLIIPSNGYKKLLTGKDTEVLLVLDGSDSNLATTVANYFHAFLAKFNSKHMPRGPEFRFSVVNFFNPELKSSHFFVPGLAAIFLMMICAMLTSITIVKEKEIGSLKLLRLAPVSPFQVIVVKLLPYLFLAVVEASLIIAVAELWFRVPFRGSLLSLGVSIFIYMFAGLSFGVFLSTIASSQAIAMILSLVLTILPSVLLSGFIFPIKSMPVLLQALTYIIPARYFLIIIRGIMLMGVGFKEIYRELVFLMVFAIFFFVISTFRLKREL